MTIVTCFSGIFDTEYLSDGVVDDFIRIYISGYGSHSVERGGLSVPTEEVIASFIHVYAIMELIINDGNLKSQFLQSLATFKSFNLVQKLLYLVSHLYFLEIL